jgi:hypothetical protein
MPRSVPPRISGDPGFGDPDHHLWRNGRLYWVAFTVHLPGWQKERVRLSLGTADLLEARRRRDELLRGYPAERGCALSLRIAGRPIRTGSTSPLAGSPTRPMAPSHAQGDGCAA